MVLLEDLVIMMVVVISSISQGKSTCKNINTPTFKSVTAQDESV
jgi:hypothetical protein